LATYEAKEELGFFKPVELATDFLLSYLLEFDVDLFGSGFLTGGLRPLEVPPGLEVSAPVFDVVGLAVAAPDLSPSLELVAGVLIFGYPKVLFGVAGAA
jgi:hypothetical protein